MSVAATKPAVEWRERRSGEGCYAKPTAKAIKELTGYLRQPDGEDGPYQGEVCLLAGLRFIPVRSWLLNAAEEQAARVEIEEGLAEFAEEVKTIRWTKIDLTEVCEDGSPIWAFAPEDYEAVWRTDHYSGNAHIKQPKRSKSFLLTMNFEDRHFPTLRYHFDSLAEAKRVGSLLAACGGIPEDERYGRW